MHLRKPENKDIPFIKSLINETRITSLYLQHITDMTETDKGLIIKMDKADRDCVHYVIASDDDEYMGSVILKNINNMTAELEIAVRSEAMHRGYAWFGMEMIIEKAFNELGLDSVYWCVPRDNKRAIRFYDKHNFHEVLDIPYNVLSNNEGIDKLKWYSVLRGDEFNVRDTVAGCRIIRVKTIPTVNAGELSFFEAMKEVPFEIKRIYYISKVPEGVRRGFHAHRELKQLLFCPYGRIQLVLENLNGREEIELSDPSIGVLIDSCTWREMIWLQKNSVLCVAASEYYDADDYIRDYEEFKKLLVDSHG